MDMEMVDAGSSMIAAGDPDRERQGESASGDDIGQSTVEYVLVMLAAAGLAVALITWIGGTDLIPSFFDTVFETITGYVA
jgi:hypothetical protein